MEQKAFDLILSKFGAALQERGFAKAERKQGKEGPRAVFLGKETAFCVLYQEKKRRFELYRCGVSGSKADENWTRLSMWLFDPEEGEAGQAGDIADDFIETACGPQQTVTAVRPARKKHRKEDNGNVDTLFFLNRFAGVFPDMKDELAEERALYGSVRAVTFTRSRLVPRIEALSSSGGDKDSLARCGRLLSELYVNGDMDVRSLVTMVVLNGLSGGAAEELKPFFNEELAKGYKAGKKMKGKKVKPEKKKKSQKYMAETLNEMDRKR